jgi:hypothetical protein
VYNQFGTPFETQNDDKNMTTATRLSHNVAIEHLKATYNVFGMPPLASLLTMGGLTGIAGLLLLFI